MFSEDRPQKILPQNTWNRDQRKHIRMEHSGSVQLVGEGKRFTGQAVNISRTGMQVVVNLPNSYESIRSITFALPNTDHTIELPCRIVRSETKYDITCGEILGLEFSYQGEAQLLLIENYIREMKNRELARAPQGSEMRQIPRADCSIRNVNLNKEGVRIFSIDNISTEGLLFSYEGELNPSETIEVDFSLPGDRRRFRISGYVTYTIRNDFQQPRNAGLRFIDPKETLQARIRNFIVASRSTSAIRFICNDFQQRGTGGGYSINGREQILRLFSRMLKHGTLLNVLLESQLAIYESKLERLNAGRDEFEVILYSSARQDPPVPGTSAYFTYNNGAGHYFKTTVTRNRDNRFTCKLPRFVLQSEKRSHQRKVLSTDLSVTVALYPEGGSVRQDQFVGRLIDISRNGFLCKVELPLHLRGVFAIGQVLGYELDVRWGLDNRGQIRHMQEMLRSDGKILLQLGIEAGIERSIYRFDRVEESEWDEKTGHFEGSGSNGFDARVVEYTNKRNQGIRALLNATRFYVKAPVIVLPPGFGKKKEVLSPLVATLLANFSLKNRDLVTLRYDGINRPGESFNCAKQVKRGYEMLHYRVQQGVEDLETTLEYVYSNPFFTPEKVILVSFSMSSLDARRYLAADARYRVDLWISAMGVPSAQSTLRNILGGIDVIGNYKMGTQNGIMGLLGHLIDMDRMAQGLVENRYAYMTDTRRDMSRISIPAIWIFGTYDKWVEEDQVIDAMSIQSESNREIIEVPVGHNLHTSDDALKVYRIITSRIFRWLTQQNIDTMNPNRDEMLRLVTYERERLQNTFGIDKQDYWKSYLIGNREADPGYDFYNNFIEFQQFMELEARLVDLQPQDHLLDLGCGTGLLLETILERASRWFSLGSAARIMAVDLIPEALEKTRRKCENLLSQYANLGSIHVEYLVENLEPSRWLPIYEYICNPGLDYSFLRNKVEGLKNSDIDRLMETDRKELRQFMRGETTLSKDINGYRALLGEGCHQRVVEFNAAARFLREALVSLSGSSSASPSPIGELEPGTFAASAGSPPDFKELHLGDPKLELAYPFASNSCTKLVASLFLSYLFNPHYAVAQFYRILRPGGTAIISSMKPDSDVSMIFTSYTDSLRRAADSAAGGGSAASEGSAASGGSAAGPIPATLSGAMNMLNEAASLFELEQEGYFKFFTAEELIAMCENSGFKSIQAYRSLGSPPQALIIVARKPLRGDE
jgi:ubiquinone/menaquinone biosynthesis C-methylase UbiE/pimeloyl-ACP methyl ester carboxylesterase